MQLGKLALPKLESPKTGKEREVGAIKKHICFSPVVQCDLRRVQCVVQLSIHKHVLLSNIVLISTFKIIIQPSLSGSKAKLHGQTGRLNENGNYNVLSRQMSCICINDFFASHLVTLPSKCASEAARQTEQRHTETMTNGRRKQEINNF